MSNWRYTLLMKRKNVTSSLMEKRKPYNKHLFKRGFLNVGVKCLPSTAHQETFVRN